MSIAYYEHSDGIKMIAKLLYDEKITPIIGSGFTRDCTSKKANVPDGNQATEIMKRIISEFKEVNLADADFNKTSDRFFLLSQKKSNGSSLKPISRK